MVVNHTDESTCSCLKKVVKMAVAKTVADLVAERIASLNKKLSKLDQEYILLRDEKYALEEEYAGLKAVKEKVVEKVVLKERGSVTIESLKRMNKLQACKALIDNRLPLMEVKKLVEDNNLYLPAN